jgi:hypothetical protein
MIIFCPFCQESDWFVDEEDDDEDEDFFVEICELCLLEEGLFFTVDESDICGYLQDVYMFYDDMFLRENDVA